MDQESITLQVTISAEDADRLGLRHLVARASSPAQTEWITAREAAAILGCHVNYVYRMIEQGRLRTKRIGPRALRIARESLQ